MNAREPARDFRDGERVATGQGRWAGFPAGPSSHSERVPPVPLPPVGRVLLVHPHAARGEHITTISGASHQGGTLDFWRGHRRTPWHRPRSQAVRPAYAPPARAPQARASAYAPTAGAPAYARQPVCPPPLAGRAPAHASRTRAPRLRSPAGIPHRPARADTVTCPRMLHAPETADEASPAARQPRRRMRMIFTRLSA